MEIDHVAIVVKDLEATLRFYTQTLGFREVYREIVSDQGVEAVGLEAGGSIVELLLPLDDDSPVARYRGDAATKLHHTAYRVADIEAAIRYLASMGINATPAKQEVGGMLSLFNDPDGNELCLWQTTA